MGADPMTKTFLPTQLASAAGSGMPALRGAADSGVAMSSRGLRSAFTPKNHATRPPAFHDSNSIM